jgi:outer membrane lipoprotein SlyB
MQKNEEMKMTNNDNYTKKDHHIETLSLTEIEYVGGGKITRSEGVLILVSGAVGARTGAAIGAVAGGPIGAAAGAVIGAGVGMIAATLLNDQD